jgi:hypothetical protein
MTHMPHVTQLKHASDAEDADLNDAAAQAQHEEETLEAESDDAAADAKRARDAAAAAESTLAELRDEVRGAI